MRVFLLVLLIGGGGCYSRPAVPHDKPLACATKAECLEELNCVAGRCVPISCVVDDPRSCPLGYGCLPPTVFSGATCGVAFDAAADMPTGDATGEGQANDAGGPG